MIPITIIQAQSMMLQKVDIKIQMTDFMIKDKRTINELKGTREASNIWQAQGMCKALAAWEAQEATTTVKGIKASLGVQEKMTLEMNKWIPH